MELMQLARIETMCNDQGVIQDFRLGGGGGEQRPVVRRTMSLWGLGAKEQIN